MMGVPMAWDDCSGVDAQVSSIERSDMGSRDWLSDRLGERESLILLP